MEIKLNDDEAMQYFYLAICNGGLSLLESSGIILEWNENDYTKAKNTLKENQPNTEICFEDILMEILNQGKTLEFVDVECDGEYSKSISKKIILENSNKVDPNVLLTYANEEDDAGTGYEYLQSILYDGEIIFG